MTEPMTDQRTEFEKEFALNPREMAHMQTFPEALEALADWYDWDASTAEYAGASERAAHDDRRAAELRVEAERLRKARLPPEVKS